MARASGARSRGNARTTRPAAARPRSPLPRARVVQPRVDGRRWGAGFVIGVIVAAGGILLTVAPTIGLERTLGISAALPARTALTAAAAAAGVVCAICAIANRGRFLLPVATALLVVAIFNAPIVVLRGFGSSTAADVTGRVAVLEWNTNGGLVAPAAVAVLAAREHADIVVLPDAGIGTKAADYRTAFASSGLDMRLYSAPGRDAQLAVFVTAGLAAQYPAGQTGPDASKTLVLEPSSPALPTIVALHAPHPTLGGIALWRSELNWVAQRCAAASVLVSGDFNASIDDFGAPSLGGCRDAAAQKGAASTGTWPTAVPSLLGMPIDHTLLTARAGSVASFAVLGSEDSSGARHRPTLTVLSTTWGSAP